MADTYNYFDPYTDPELAARKRLADSLMQSGSSTAPIYDPAAGVARLASALFGGYQQGQVQKDADILMQKRREDMANFMQPQSTPEGPQEMVGTSQTPINWYSPQQTQFNNQVRSGVLSSDPAQNQMAVQMYNDQAKQRRDMAQKAAEADLYIKKAEGTNPFKMQQIAAQGQNQLNLAGVNNEAAMRRQEIENAGRLDVANAKGGSGGKANAPAAIQNKIALYKNLLGMMSENPDFSSLIESNAKINDAYQRMKTTGGDQRTLLNTIPGLATSVGQKINLSGVDDPQKISNNYTDALAKLEAPMAFMRNELFGKALTKNEEAIANRFIPVTTGPNRDSPDNLAKKYNAMRRLIKGSYDRLMYASKHGVVSENPEDLAKFGSIAEDGSFMPNQSVAPQGLPDVIDQAAKQTGATGFTPEQENALSLYPPKGKQ